MGNNSFDSDCETGQGRLKSCFQTALFLVGALYRFVWPKDLWSGN